MNNNKQKNDNQKSQHAAFFVIGVALGVAINWGVGLAFIGVYFVKEYITEQEEKAKKQEVPVKVKRDEF